nr:hypothetical protein [Mucilaginibacter sp. SP1R1]
MVHKKIRESNKKNQYICALKIHKYKHEIISIQIQFTGVINST